MIVAMLSVETLLERLRALPAAAPLLDALDGDPRVWVVGGAVRDLLLGGAPVDLDLLVEGDADALARRLAAALGGELRLHDRFGTATVRTPEHAYDLARARAERYARPGALPDVRPGTLAEDLLRRDFTVNAVAVALDGRVEAAPHAFEDLAAKRLRVLHDASFRDDPTRLLRLVRYATRLAFEVEGGTEALARAALSQCALRSVTPARLGAELRLLLREPSAFAALEWAGSWEGAWEVGLSFDAAVAERAASLLPPEGRRDLLLLAVAVRGVAPGSLAAWLDALGFTARERDTVLAAATEADRISARLGAATRPAEIAAAVRGAPVEAVALAGALGHEFTARRWLDALRHVTLEIDGADLLAAGVPQGEAVGRGLAAALRAKRDGEASGREAELAVALAAISAAP
jgi:tRNA nucleotidyltransferase (CCA-adding enzyme)